MNMNATVDFDLIERERAGLAQTAPADDNAHGGVEVQVHVNVHVDANVNLNADATEL